MFLLLFFYALSYFYLVTYLSKCLQGCMLQRLHAVDCGKAPSTKYTFSECCILCCFFNENTLVR